MSAYLKAWARIRDSLEVRTRDNGTKFVCRKDGLPEDWDEKLCEAIQTAHNAVDALPNDAVYRIILNVAAAAVEMLEDNPDFDLWEMRDELVEGQVPDDTPSLTHWLHHAPGAVEAVEYAIADGHVDASLGVFHMLWAGFLMWASWIYDPIEALAQSEAENKWVYTIREGDVGAAVLNINVTGRKWLVSNFMGQIFPEDVGRRIYWDSEADILQVESRKQSDSREKWRRPWL